MVEKIFSARKKEVRVKSILDRSFHYTPSVQTDLKKTFARIRREQRGQIRTNRTGTQAAAETRTKVVPMRQHKTEMA